MAQEVETLAGDVTVEIETTMSTEQIQAMIAQLSVTEENESLRKAMDNLKGALKANPAACAALLPEDIGAMVSVLKKITGRDIEDAAAGRKKGQKKEKFDITKLTPEQEQSIMDDLF